MKALQCTMAMLAITLMGHSQVSLDGHAVIYDSRQNRFLCPMPAHKFGTDQAVTVTVTSERWSGVEVDGTPITAPDTRVTMTALDGVTPHTLTATVDGQRQSYTLLLTSLPVLEVNAELSKDYRPATLALHHPDSSEVMSLHGRIKWRGHSTLSANRHKRNFHIKLEDEHGDKLDVKLLGMRSDNSWMLDGGQTDLSRIRNYVAHELWLDMAAKPYYADREPKARSGSRGELIELLVNGQYEGIYTLMEAMDRKQLKLTKYETDSAGVCTIHGQLWKANDYTSGTTFSATSEANDSLEQWYGFDTKYPDIDEVWPTDYSVLTQAVNFAVTSYDYLWRRKAGNYFDLPVLRDYTILLQTLLAIDNAAKNIYWATYDSQVDHKLTLAIWDMDCTVGQDWTNTPFRPQDRVGPEIDWKISNNVLGRLNLLIADFRQGLIDRYWELRRGPLHTDSLIHRYHSKIDLLIAAGAAARESERWSGDSDLGGHELDWEAEKQYIADWFTRRMRHLDITRFATAGIDPVSDTNNELPTGTYNLLGIKMSDTQPLPPGIYVRNGKKIAIVE